MTAVDRLAGIHAGLGEKAPVVCATTANITLAALQTIDGIVTTEGMRVLVKDQSTASENGIYAATSGTWSRSKDADGSRDFAEGTGVYVSRGTVNAGSTYRISTTGDITIGTTSITWASGGSITNNQVTNALLNDMATQTFKGRTTAGTGDPEDLTVTQATAMLNVVTSGLKGLAPASGGGSVNFLRADGTWTTPAGAGTVTDGDKGDITISGTGTVFTIDNDAVTYAKMQNVSATQRVLARNTAGAGDTEEVAISTIVDWIGSTRGSVLYRGAAGWAALTPGTVNYVLKSGGAGADPSWGASSGVFELIGSSAVAPTTANVEQTFATGTYNVIRLVYDDIDTTSAAATIVVTLRTSGAAVVTLTGSGSVTTQTSGWAEFVIGSAAATKRCGGTLLDTASNFVEVAAVGSNATEVDRVRIAPSASTMDAGNVYVYGIRRA